MHWMVLAIVGVGVCRAQVTDPAVYTIQDDLTLWGTSNGYLSDFSQIPATNFLGNVVMFPVQLQVPEYGFDDYIRVFPSSAVFSTVMTSTGEFYNDATPDHPPNIQVCPFGFNWLYDLPRPADFDYYTNDEDIDKLCFVSTTQAFQNKVFYYYAFINASQWSVKSYTADGPSATPTPLPNPTPQPTPALLFDGNPKYVRNGTWTASQNFSAPFRITAMTSAIGRDDSTGAATVNLWLCGQGQIAVLESDDGTNFAPYATKDPGGNVVSLATTPIVYATTNDGNLAQGNGTLCAWVTDDGVLHVSILVPVVLPDGSAGHEFRDVSATALTFFGQQFDTVQIAAGTARKVTPSGSEAVNAVQFFLTSGDNLWRAEYVIPQNSAGNPQTGDFTTIGGAPLFVPQVDGSAVTVSRLCRYSSSLSLVTTLDPQPLNPPTDPLSVIQESLVLLGANNPRQSNTISALIMKSNVLVPWGVDKNTKTASPYKASDTKSFTDDDDYEQWKLLGVIMGLPPFTPNSSQPSPTYGEDISQIEITSSSSHTDSFETTSENSVAAGIDTPDNPFYVKTEDILTHSYLFTQLSTTGSVATVQLPLSATPETQAKGWLLVLQPNVTTQLYKMSDWTSTPISLDGTTAGEYTYYLTTYAGPVLALKEFDLTNPGAHPWSAGLTAFPDSSDLESWSSTMPPADVFNASSSVGSNFVTNTPSSRLHLEDGQGEGPSVTFTQETDQETSDTRAVDFEMSSTTFGVYSSDDSSVTTSVTTTTDGVLELKFSEKFQPGSLYNSFDVDVFGFVIRNPDSPFIPTAYQKQMKADKFGNAGSTPFLFAYQLAGTNQNPPAPDTTSQRPQFVTQPVNKETGFGKSVSFVAAVGDPAGVTYQWFQDEKAINGATSATLTISSPTLANTGFYHVRATNAFGTARSREARLIVAKTPNFVRQPDARAIAFPGGKARFEAKAEGAGTLSYQWYLNGDAIDGATEPVYIFKDIPAGLAPYASIYVKASNASGTATSSASQLNVVLPPKLVTPPSAITVPEGGAAIFDVVASSENPIHYRWLVGGKPVDGTNGPRLVLPDVALADNGASIVVNLSGPGGVTVTTPVTLSVVKSTGFPGAIVVRGNQTAKAGRSAVLSISLIGDATIQWFKDGQLLGGERSTALRIKNASADSAGLYTVRLTNSKGSTEVVVGTLTVKQAPPAFSVQPKSQEVRVGQRAVFFARVASDRPVTYEWFFNGQPVSFCDVSGANSDRLVIPKVRAAHAGIYRVRATNAFGTVTSHRARLEVR